jgi:hypothetical protein
VRGMSPGLETNNPAIVAVFHLALRHQGLVVLSIVAVAWVTLNVLRTQQFRRAALDDGPPVPRLSGRIREPSALRLLRISFGLIFLLDKSATVSRRLCVIGGTGSDCRRTPPPPGDTVTNTVTVALDVATTNTDALVVEGNTMTVWTSMGGHMNGYRGRSHT